MSRLEWPYVVSEAGIVHRVLVARPWGAYGQMVAVETVCNGWLLHVPKGSLRRHKPRGARLCRKCFGPVGGTAKARRGSGKEAAG
ncbi:MAG TPA: hypothetical protein VMX94_12050 [Armatimonadota bacterium]|nr:hypothetical protein [Armatimonadota bacterium]